MIDFFTVQIQAEYFGYASNLPFAAFALLVAIVCLLTKNRNHIYTWLGITSFLVFLFRIAQSFFIIIPVNDSLFPYLQFTRTTLDQLSGVAGLIAIYYIFKVRQ